MNLYKSKGKSSNKALLKPKKIFSNIRMHIDNPTIKFFLSWDFPD